MLIDLHTHTYPKSDDSHLTPAELILEAKRVGLDGLCLTEHDGFWEEERLEELSRAFSLPIFRGCEVTTEEGHLLVFGLHRYIFGMHRAAFVRRLAQEAGAVIVVAHPYRRKYREEETRSRAAYDSMLDRACQENLFALVDAVEVMNGRGSEAENAFAQAISRRFGLPGTGASDAHRREDVGTYATEFAAPVRTLDNLIHELKGGNYRATMLQRRQAVASPAVATPRRGRRT